MAEFLGGLRSHGRRLARALGGDLCLDPAACDGAAFVLELPAV